MALRYIIGSCISMLLCSCLDVQDHVYLRKDFQVEWSLHLSGNLKDWSSYFEGWNIFSLEDTSQEVSVSRIFHKPSDIQDLDSSGFLGPLRQRMDWHRDSVGNVHFTRSIRLERDIPGDDGAYADRLLSGIYRGYTCSFSVQVPGKILRANPTPLQVDTMHGEVRWDIPLAQMIRSPLEMEVVSEALPTQAPSDEKARFVFLAIAAVLFLASYPIALWLRRK